MVKRFSFSVVLCFVFAAGAAGQPDKGLKGAQIADFSHAHSLPYLSSDMTLFENVLVDGQHYALIAGWKNTKLEPISWQLLNTVQIPRATITIDGKATDWASIPPAVVDPAGDKYSGPGASSRSGTDLAAVYVARDNDNFYFRMTFYDGDPSEDTLYVVEFQQFLTQLHTPGDLFVAASKPTGQQWNVSVSQRIYGNNPIIISNLGTGYAAGGTGFVEWRVPISDLQAIFNPLVPNPYFPAAPLGPQGVENRFVRTYIHPTPSPVSDENDPLTRPLIVNFNQ